MKQKDYRLAAIMYTDIRGFSRMMEKDEAGTLKLLQFHNELVVGIVKEHGGTVIKTIGDAFLIDFRNTVDSLTSALEIQDKLYAYNKEHADFPLLLRIGLHLGDIYFYENDALGEGINIASRLQSIAHPGCICMSQDVYNLVLNKLDFEAAKLGRVSLKNISKEIHAYEITTPNVEFDPDYDKPRPGYKPGAYVEGQPGGAGDAQFVPESAEGSAAAGPGAARAAMQAPEASETPESASIKARDAIKRSILGDIKSHGRRLTAEEVRQKYGMYGADVETVIQDLSSKGILQRGPASATPRATGAQAPAGSGFQPGAFANRPSAPGGSYTERFLKIGEQIVEEVTKSIEQGMSNSGRGDMRRMGRDFRGQFRQELRSGSRFDSAPPAAPQPPRPGMDYSDEFGDRKSRALDSKWERKLANSPFSSVKENVIQDFSIYRDQVIASARRSKVSFIPNVASWLGVSALLVFINSFAPGFSVPWVVFPFFSWGVGIVEHFFAARRKDRKAKELGKMPVLNADQLTLFKRINLAKDSFIFHGVSTITVSAMLAAFNAFTALVGGPFPWAVFPIAAFVVSFISHAAVHFPRVKQLETSFIKSLGLTGSWESLFSGSAENVSAIPAGPYQEMYSEAISIKAGIIEQLKQGKKRHGPVDKDLIPALDEYVGQIRLLATRAGEVDAIVDTIPMAALKTDKEELLRKEAASSNDRMKREYRKSVEEIEHQERSFQELENQREMLKLRLKSGVNSLKQMRIEVARLSTMPEMDEDSAVLMVKQRSSEISQYLEDLRTGFSEEERDPYAELAEAERERAESARIALESAPSPPDAEVSANDAKDELNDLETEMRLKLAADGNAAAAEAASPARSADQEPNALPERVKKSGRRPNKKG
jgi:class 3 adenylate cyclase